MAKHRTLCTQTHRYRIWFLTIVLLLGNANFIQSQTIEPIRYTLHFPEARAHYVEVEASIPTNGQKEVELMLASWTPGSYMIRDYARNVETVSARSQNQERLQLQKTQKNRWRIWTNGASTISVSYRVYSREMSVRTNWVEDDFAMLNGAPTFLTLVEDLDRPHEVTLVLPRNWSRAMSGLPTVSESTQGKTHTYLAQDFDTLVDSPIVVGNPAIYEFNVDGTPHYLVNIGEGGIWDGPQSARDVEKIVRENHKMWGSLPYKRYVFLNMITEAGGGLEHKNSTLLMTSRWQSRTRSDYLRWLSTVSHEHFHTWNVKRLRPVELGPFDYESEAYSRSLWIVEGLTSYYADLTLHRAGLSTRSEYLSALSRHIAQLQLTPGRLIQSVEQASYNAWIKYYRPDANSINTAISYYTKGAVIGFLLDATIRQTTANIKSLDHVMRLAYQKYSMESGYTPEEFRTTIEEIAGTNLSTWFSRTLETTEELDYTEALTWFGLEFSQNGPGRDPNRAWLGLITQTEEGRLLVSQVRRQTPAYRAGFNVNDELIAIGDYRVTAREWNNRLQQYRPGDQVPILIARRGQLKQLETTFEAEPLTNWQLRIRRGSNTAQTAHIDSWLKFE